MKKVLGNPVAFVLLYILFMLPTYYLPYVGSNSAVIGALGQAGAAASDAHPLAGINPAFWLHLGSLMVLVALAWFRGGAIGKTWLIIFPILAAIFDLAPGVNLIPLVPTVMHLLAIILGVAASAPAAAQQTGT